jgi:hypothetical protein
MTGYWIRYLYVIQQITHFFMSVGCCGTTSKMLLYGVGCLWSIFEKIEPRSRPVGPKSKPAVVGLYRRCLGGALTHTTVELKEDIAVGPRSRPYTLEPSPKHAERGCPRRRGKLECTVRRPTVVEGSSGKCHRGQQCREGPRAATVERWRSSSEAESGLGEAMPRGPTQHEARRRGSGGCGWPLRLG